MRGNEKLRDLVSFDENYKKKMECLLGKNRGMREV